MRPGKLLNLMTHIWVMHKHLRIYTRHVYPLSRPCKYRTVESFASLSRQWAIYLMAIRRADALPAASFRFHLTMDTLAVRLVVPLAGSTGDLHPQVIRPAPPEPEQRPSRRYAPCLAHNKKAPSYGQGFSSA